MSRTGFIHDKLDIKFLILYLMARVASPVDFATLADLTFCDDGVEYFDFAASSWRENAIPSPRRADAMGKSVRAAWPSPSGGSVTGTWPGSTASSAGMPRCGRRSFPGRTAGSPCG